MANGNGTNPARDSQAIERLQAVADAATQAATAAPLDDFITRAEGLFQYLETIGRELESAGGADEREIAAFAAGQRSELHAFVRKLIGRYRRRVSDLERIMGKIER